VVESRDAREIKKLRLPAAVSIVLRRDKNTMGRFHFRSVTGLGL
jgi:hypothetical protein